MAPTTSSYPSRTARRLTQYLRAEAERADGDLYVTPAAVADEVDLSPDDVRATFVAVGDSVPGLTIEPQSTGLGTRWRVSVV